MRARLPAAFLVASLGMAACTTSSGVTSETSDEAAPTASPWSTVVEVADAAPPVVVVDGDPFVDGVANSLVLVHDRDGGEESLVAYRADGTVATVFDVAPGEVVWQPIWSPDGRRVAWTRTIDGAVWELTTAAADGTDRTTHLLPGRPDYITYDPTSERVLALTPSPEGFGLVVVDVGDEDRISVVDVGQPYFTDFSPDGSRVIAHVGTDLRIVDVTGQAGATESIGLTSATHQTPSWHPIDETVVVGSDTQAGRRLVVYDVATGDTTDLASFSSFVFFDLDPTGTRLAVSSFAPDGDLEAARRRQADPTSLGAGLWTVDLDGGATEQLVDGPTIAPMWDPTGSRVLVRETIDGTSAWTVFGLDGTQAATADHDIDDTLLPLYLPFWDQYARSQTVWAPDGEQFVHVGEAADGTSGVWIHDASFTGPSTYLADGDVAFWSPT